MSKAAKSKCNHALAFEVGVDEAWLIYADSDWRSPEDVKNADVVFNFCPLCGEKLEKPKE